MPDDDAVVLDVELLAAWRDHPRNIGETRAVVADWLERVAAGVGHVPTAPWLAQRLAVVVAELDAFTANIAAVELWRDAQTLAGLEDQFPPEAA